MVPPGIECANRSAAARQHESNVGDDEGKTGGRSLKLPDIFNRGGGADGLPAGVASGRKVQPLSEVTAARSSRRCSREAPDVLTTSALTTLPVASIVNLMAVVPVASAFSAAGGYSGLQAETLVIAGCAATGATQAPAAQQAPVPARSSPALAAAASSSVP